MSSKMNEHLCEKADDVRAPTKLLQNKHPRETFRKNIYRSEPGFGFRIDT